MAGIQKRQHHTKNQLLSALDDIYIRALKDHHIGYMNQSICAILQHLFDNYGNITPLELEDNPTVLSIVSSNKSKMDKTTPTMAANPTPPNNSYTSPTPWSSKQASTLKTAKPGMHVPPLNTPGTTSKHISRPPNVYYETKCAQPNKPASSATLPNLHNHPPPTHQQNIKQPSST